MLAVLLSSPFLQGDANSVQVSIQLKLNEKVKNSFEYCEVHLPFFHRFVVFAWFKKMITASLSSFVYTPFKVGPTLSLPLSRACGLQQLLLRNITLTDEVKPT